MHKPLVSILIPFKNVEAFLEECLNSIINQAYQSWEVLAINDHSTDSSFVLANSFVLTDPRIQVFNNNGNGIIEALRQAYSISNGAFITRMDADDIMAPNRLQEMVGSLLDFGKGHLAIGQVKYFSEQGISNGYERYEQWLNALTATGKNYAEIYKECVIPSPCWMVHREDLDTCGAFDANHYPEDYDLAFRFYENGLHCIPCETVLHHWRDYDTRTSRTSEHYAQNYFLDIKLLYFLKLNRNPSRPLVIWGAGAKGKTIAKSLQKKQINFYWVCDNTNKIGKNIYQQKMLHYSELEQWKKPQIIITVANKEAQVFIYDFLAKLKSENMSDYFFFC